MKLLLKSNVSLHGLGNIMGSLPDTFILCSCCPGLVDELVDWEGDEIPDHNNELNTQESQVHALLLVTRGLPILIGKRNLTGYTFPMVILTSNKICT